MTPTIEPGLPELLPCPFCGADAFFNCYPDEDTEIGVECSKCCAVSRDDCRTHEEAAGFWNRRSPALSAIASDRKREVSAGLSDEVIKDVLKAHLSIEGWRDWLNGEPLSIHQQWFFDFARTLASRLLPPDWVAVKDRLLIDVCYIEGDDPFICGVYGKAPLNTLADIEAQLCQSIEEEDGLLTEEGEYRFTARYEPAQRGDYGRIEFEAYWDLTQVSFTPLDEAIEGNSQQAKPRG
jgi:hypothetical protein